MGYNPISLSFRAKKQDLDRLQKIRERLQSVNKKSWNSSVIRFALEYTENNWFPHKSNN